MAISKRKYHLECVFDNCVHVNEFWVLVILENEFALSKVIEKTAFCRMCFFMQVESAV